MAWNLSKIERKKREIRDIKLAMWEAEDEVIRNNLEKALKKAYEELDQLEKESN